MSDATDTSLVAADLPEHAGSALDQAIERDLGRLEQGDALGVDTPTREIGTTDESEQSLVQKIFGPQKKLDEDLTEDDDEGEDEEEEEPKRKLSRRERRIVNLKKRLDKSESAREDAQRRQLDLERAYAALNENAQAVDKQFRANQTALMRLETEVKMMRELGSQPAKDENQQALEKFQRDTIQEAQKVVSPRVVKLERELAQMKKRLAMQAQEQQDSVKEQRLKNDAALLVDEVILGAGFPKEVRNQVLDGYGTTLHERLQYLVLQDAYMRQLPIDKVVEDIPDFLRAWALGHFEAQTKNKGDKIARGQKIATSGVAGAGGSATKQRKKITQADADAAGYETPLAYRAALDLGQVE